MNDTHPTYSYFRCLYGIIQIACTSHALLSLQLVPAHVQETTENPLHVLVAQQLGEYLSGSRRDFTIPLELHGTDFQKRVWKALCDIPYGQTRSYKEIAKAIGNEKASRAVGMANNRNPIFIIVPCHRVIGANKSLVGYAGGLEMKRGLLDLEEHNTFIPR